MRFSQYLQSDIYLKSSSITQEEIDKITDIEIENTNEIVFKTPSGKEVLFRKVKYGEWIRTNPLTDTFECSLCGMQVPVLEMCSPFCPLCGADMRKRSERNEEDN